MPNLGKVSHGILTKVKAEPNIVNQSAEMHGFNLLESKLKNKKVLLSVNVDVMELKEAYLITRATLISQSTITNRFAHS